MYHIEGEYTTHKIDFMIYILTAVANNFRSHCMNAIDNSAMP